jgi:hypothetical protein
MNQSREAHLAERSLHSPEGALSWTDERSRGWVGYAIAGAGNAVGIDVGHRPRAGPGEARRPVCGAGLRSLPAKQHAPKVRPSPATDRGRRRPGSQTAKATGRRAPLGRRPGPGDRTATGRARWLRRPIDGDPGPLPSPAVRSLAQSQSSRTVMYQPGRSAGATVKCAWPWPLRWDATGKSWVNAQV